MKMQKEINSNPIFITSVKGDGNTKINFIFNYSLISHCEKKKYNCINLAKKLEGKFNYWRNESHTHTSIKGSEIIANLIFRRFSGDFKKSEFNIIKKIVYPRGFTPNFERTNINTIINIITKAGNHSFVLLNKKLNIAFCLSHFRS